MVRELYIIGIGMGNPNTLTIAAQQALEDCDLIIGAQRLLDALSDFDAHKKPLVGADKIVHALHECQAQRACVVMSGDVGFYSGANQLYERLESLDASVEVLPGVSSLSYLCAQLHTAWHDAYVVSAHGRTSDVTGAVQSHAKTFVLAGTGASSARGICEQLVQRELGNVTVHVGERRSYADERITSGTAAELSDQDFHALSALLVLNPTPVAPHVRAPHLPDSAFLRERVPMTKEEVREVAICKLRIAPNHVVWDVGAGTGSVSVEAARAACEGQVFAVERSPQAQDLLRRNKEAFCLPNLHVVEGEAPYVLASLPAPDRVFVGGSGGRLEDVLRAALAANPRARLCITAVTLETLGEAVRCTRELDLANVDIVQLSVAKAHKAGASNLLRANNPVYVISAEGAREDCEERG